MFLYIYAYIYIYIYIYIYVYISISVSISISISIHIYLYLSLYLSIYPSIYLYLPSRLSPQWVCGNSCAHIIYIMCPNYTWTIYMPNGMSCHKAIVGITGGHIIFMITYILCSSCFCEI